MLSSPCCKVPNGFSVATWFNGYCKQEKDIQKVLSKMFILLKFGSKKRRDFMSMVLKEYLCTDSGHSVAQYVADVDGWNKKS